MKKNFYLAVVTVLLAIALSQPSFAQKYKQADSLKLLEDYAQASKDVAGLKEKLTEAQNELPDLQSKALAQTAQAQAAARESSQEASKATSGDLSEIKKAKRKANAAVDEAEDAKNAEKKVNNQNKKIEKLQSQLEKKQKKLQELETKRAEIFGSASGS
jgi:chromosome segregation ATPase